MCIMVVYLAILEVLPMSPFDVAAERFALRLRLREEERQDHLVVHVECVHVLLLEVDTDAEALELSRILEPVQRVAPEAGDGLRDDEVDLARLAVGNQLVELLALLGRGAGDALVGVQPYHRPFGVRGDLRRVVFDLRLVAGELFFRVRGYAAVRRDAQVLAADAFFLELRVCGDILDRKSQEIGKCSNNCGIKEVNKQ